MPQLQADSSANEAAALAAQGVRDWYAFRGANPARTLVDSWGQPLPEILG